MSRRAQAQQPIFSPESATRIILMSMESTETAAAEAATKPQFTPQTTVGEALRIHPEAGLVLASYHLGGCSHCGINEIETLEQICMGYGVPIDALVASMNALLED